MKNRSRLLKELTENCWAIYPEHYTFMLNFLMGNIAPDKALAEEMREKAEYKQKENISMVGNTDIGYIPLMGTIYPRSNMMTEMCGGISLSSLTKDFITMRDDPNIKGIIMDVDGPGGAATGVNEFTNLVYASRGIKPIYAYVGGTSASATFWITSAADKVFADATARVGSVGTVVGVPKKGTDDAYIEITNSLSPYKRPDVENEDHYKNIVKYLDDMTDVFYESLARNFELSKDYVINNFGQGGMKVGKTALESKMVHEISSFAGTVESMLEVITDPNYAPKERKVYSVGNSVDSNNSMNVNAELSEENGGIMDLKELREKHPQLVAELETEFSANSAKELASVVSEKDGVIAKLTEENETLKKSASEMEKDALQSRTEVAKSKAKMIFTAKMAASSIPESFTAKVEKQVPFASFVDETGKLDEGKYSDAVSAEIADWEATFSTSGGKEIAGVVTGDGEEKGEEKSTEVDETISRLISLV